MKVGATNVRDQWPKFQLRTNMRSKQCAETGSSQEAKRLQDYTDWLLEMGNGQLPVLNEFGSDVVEIPSDLTVNGQSAHAVVNHVYGQLEEKYTDSEWLAARALLTTKNETVSRRGEDFQKCGYSRRRTRNHVSTGISEFIEHFWTATS